VEGLRVSRVSSRAVGFEKRLLNALLGMGKILRKNERMERPKENLKIIVFTVALKANLENL